MQIFATYQNPISCALVLDDKRLIKMTVESAQILSTYLWEQGIEGPYKPTHLNHPITRWMSLSPWHYRWLVRHFSALISEYHQRFPEKGPLKVEQHLEFFRAHDNYHGMPEVFCKCVPDHLRHLETHAAYRTLLFEKWQNDKHAPKWGGKTLNAGQQVELLDLFVEE